MSKINKWLQDGIDGKLTKTQMLEFRKELVFVEMERRKAALDKELKVFKQNFFQFQYFHDIWL